MAKELTEVEHHNYGPAVAALSEKHREFVFAVCEGSSGSDAVRKAGYECTSAESYASRANTLHRRQDIIAALSEQVAKQMRALGPAAVRSVHEVLGIPVTLNPAAKLAAAKLILSRVDPEVSRVDANVNVRVEVIDHNKEAVEQLRTLQALKVPEIELVRLFGPSGLDRYRRMIATADKAVVDVEFTELPTEDDELNQMLGAD
jgi:hypothetical protein